VQASTEQAIVAHFVGGGPLSGKELILPPIYLECPFPISRLTPFYDRVEGQWTKTGTYGLRRDGNGQPEPYNLRAVIFDWLGWHDGTA
jgi:hypothetical protein